MRAATVTILLICSTLFSATAQDSSRRSKFLPEYVKVQFAGGIGFLSVGTGYNNKKEKLEGDLWYGYVPQSVGGVEIHSLSAKVTWHPVKKKEWRSYELRPLSLGALASYTFGKQYFLFSPKNYPYSYYNFPTALHGGVFIGGRLDRKLSSGKKLGIYYELGTNDRELVSYGTNLDAISPLDILNLAIGAKLTF
jgi:hypothetical protein